MRYESSFIGELTSSLALNTSVEGLHIKTTLMPSSKNCQFEVTLVKTIGCENKTIKNIFSAEEKVDLQNALQQNYTLEEVRVLFKAFVPITELNKAGRRYLLDDGASRSKCIAVLAKVKHDIDSLFIHLRENPILCMGDSSGDDARGRCKGANEGE